jgi:pimeloyl-ACP methyl ester carboxylesterase
VPEHVTSADGTAIAIERFGDGPPVVLLGGMFNVGAMHQPLAEQLAAALPGQATGVTVDRRGRGASGNTLPYAVAREVEDVAAVVDAVGGSAALYGHSSGASLALEAAAAGVPVTRLVLHEPPYGDDTEESKAASRSQADTIKALIDEDRRTEAISMFLTAMGAPPDVVEATAALPNMQAVAPTMPYDFAVNGDFERGGVIPVDHVRSISVPTLVLAGTASPEFFLTAAQRVADLLPDGRYQELEGADHGVPADVVAPVVAAFLSS